ncbi:MAG: Rrf2 family transcriptional regulator, partial [Acidobacteriota bacterium]|nr:Rrf2 family transcriptional regulator [Acidobacteriota bacterium]
AVLYLSLRYPNVVTIHEVAEGHHIPLKYLEQILLALKKKGMLESRRGVHGGYTLARSPENISVGEVLRAVDGSFSETGCLRASSDDHYACPEAGSCGLRQLWGNVQQTIDRLLFETTFAEVCRRTNSSPVADAKSAGFPSGT